VSRDFEQAVARARVIEQAVAAWLMRRRCQILPVYDYSGLGKGKAPKLAGASRSLVTPDLLVAREGMTTWVEVKWKTSATLHKTSGSVDTGIERRLWDHYSEVERVTGIPVWIVFVHQTEREIRGEPISTLKSCARFGVGAGAGMVYFPVAKIRQLASFQDVMREGMVA
jgi:hypothetical protein